MNKKTVHYLSLRSYPDFEKEKRRNPPSAQKVDYIIDVLNNLGYRVNYVSFSESANNRFYRAKKKKLSALTDFYLCPNVPGKYRESFAFRWFTLFYAKMHIKKGDILLVYHTNSMRNDLLRAVADKYSMDFICEVEEVYALVQERPIAENVKREIEYLQCADKYIFCTETLANTVNRRQKPYTFVEGYLKYSKNSSSPFDDNLIHCVYGGIIDNVKGGAFSIVDACKYLPENYVVHILGYGNTEKLINKINSTATERKCKLKYEGLKNGNDYIDFISKCHIGLCIQSMREDYNSVSFPSKLVLYLSCGLRVVACDVPVLKSSKLADKLVFYSEDTPESIANAIMSIDISKSYDSKALMDEMDNRFKYDLEKLLEA